MLIPVVTIPLSLVGAGIIMAALGFSLNLLTLLAMVLAIGLVVDDAIVVLENVYRHIEEGRTPAQAALIGAREIAGPVISMTLTLAAVYAPIGFLGGVTGALFREFAFTLAGAVIISGVVAVTLSPMMCSLLLSREMLHGRFVHLIDRAFSRLAEWYGRKLVRSLDYRPVTTLFAAAVFASLVFMYMNTKAELAPEEDQGVLFALTKAPQYSNLDYQEAYTDKLDQAFGSFPETDLRFILNGRLGPNQGIAGAILKPWAERSRSAQQLKPLMQQKTSAIEGMNAFVFSLPPLPGSIGGLPVQMVIYSTGDYKDIYLAMDNIKAQFGEPIATTVTGPSGTVAGIAEERDHLGRVTSRTTTTGSTHHTTTYRYDAAGRLAGETTDGKATSYGYDAAGNLTSTRNPSGTTTNTYDARNALVRSGSTTFSYDGSGRLASAKGPDGTTTYRYDPLGNLTGVDRPGKPAISYSLDGLGRRVARASGGAVIGAIAYLDPIRPAATFTATGALDEVYVYDGDLQPADINDGGGSLPAYLAKGGTAYLEVPDVSGGPALVIDSATGAITDAVDRSALGALRSDTDPGFQVIGYGGGIIDPATDLVKIGARDYDTTTGRWTAPDPVGMAGGSANLYTYVSGDPVNRTDPRGTCDYVGIGISGGAGLGPIAGGGGVGVAWAGGQFGTYSTVSGGGGLVGDLGIGVTVTCLNSDNGDTSLGNFSGTGSSVEGTVGPASGGSDKGYDSAGNQSSHGGHGTASFGGGLGGSAQGSLTSIVCLLGCPPPPGPTVCGDLGCSSGPGKSPENPGSGSGSGSIPTSGPRSTGDPHIRTADGDRYDMMAVGEFVWATTDSGDLMVQVRQQPLTGSRTISLNTAIAILVDGDKLQITPPKTSGPVALSVVGAPDIPPVGTFPLPGGAIVMRTPTLTTITAKDSTEFWIRTNPSGLDIVGAFPDSAKGKVHGLVGPFTGAGTGKVETSAGKTIPIADLNDYTTLYRAFAGSWRITQSESLFTDRPGKDATAFNDPTFPDRAPPAIPADRAAAAKAACLGAGLTGADLAECEYDVGRTGDAGYATASTAAAGIVPGAAPTTGSGSGTPTGTVSGDIVPGRTVSGTVAGGAHTDYTFTVPAGTVGYFAADPKCAKDQSGSVIWNIQDSTGSYVVGSSVICSDLGRVVFDQAGTYRIVVDNSGTAAADFKITWEVSRPDQTKPLQAGQTATGTIDKPGAQDVWTMTVAAGTVAYLAADASCDPATQDAIIWNVRDATGGYTVGSSVICSDLGRVVFDQAGTYRIVVASSDGKTGGYSVTWQVSRPDQTKPLQAGQTATGTIDKPGAQDVWTMTVAAGTVAYLAADASCDPATQDAIIWNVRDATGGYTVGSSVICSDLGRVVFDQAGTYRIVVASSDGKTGGYSVTWQVSRPDQTKPLQAGQTATGTIDKPGAQDVWTMTVPAGTVVNLAADPACDAANGVALTWAVVDAEGSYVVGSSSICTDLGAVKVPAAGTYRIIVASQNGKTGAYSFRWTS